MKTPLKVQSVTIHRRAHLNNATCVADMWEAVEVDDVPPPPPLTPDI